MRWNLRSAQRREGGGTSAGNTVDPVGTETVASGPAVNHFDTSSRLSQYSRAEEAAVPVNQYRLRLSRICSRDRPPARSSAQATSVSPIQAANPAGESSSA